MKIIYDCPLREFLLGDDPVILEIVVPELIAYHSIRIIQKILNTKSNEKKKELEKAEREGKKVSF
jgi:hypothetical protein